MPVRCGHWHDCIRRARLDGFAVGKFEELLVLSRASTGDSALAWESRHRLRAADGGSLGPEWHDSIMDSGCPRKEWLDGYRDRRDKAGW